MSSWHVAFLATGDGADRAHHSHQSRHPWMVMYSHRDGAVQGCCSWAIVAASRAINSNSREWDRWDCHAHNSLEKAEWNGTVWSGKVKWAVVQTIGWRGEWRMQWAMEWRVEHKCGEWSGERSGELSGEECGMQTVERRVAQKVEWTSGRKVGGSGIECEVESGMESGRRVA